MISQQRKIEILRQFIDILESSPDKIETSDMVEMTAMFTAAVAQSLSKALRPDSTMLPEEVLEIILRVTRKFYNIMGSIPDKVVEAETAIQRAESLFNKEGVGALNLENTKVINDLWNKLNVPQTKQ